MFIPTMISFRSGNKTGRQMSAEDDFFDSTQWIRVSSKSNIIVCFLVEGGRDLITGLGGF